jgi:hypothetical protein
MCMQNIRGCEPPEGIEWGGGGEAIAPPFYTVPHCSKKVGGVMCHMYMCKDPKPHGLVLVIIMRIGHIL